MQKDFFENVEIGTMFCARDFFIKTDPENAFGFTFGPTHFRRDDVVTPIKSASYDSGNWSFNV